jgi:hypothetical protein
VCQTMVACVSSVALHMVSISNLLAFQNVFTINDLNKLFLE